MTVVVIIKQQRIVIDLAVVVFKLKINKNQSCSVRIVRIIRLGILYSRILKKFYNRYERTQQLRQEQLKLSKTAERLLSFLKRRPVL